MRENVSMTQFCSYYIRKWHKLKKSFNTKPFSSVEVKITITFSLSNDTLSLHLKLKLKLVNFVFFIEKNHQIADFFLNKEGHQIGFVNYLYGSRIFFCL